MVAEWPTCHNEPLCRKLADWVRGWRRSHRQAQEGSVSSVTRNKVIGMRVCSDKNTSPDGLPSFGAPPTASDKGPNLISANNTNTSTVPQRAAIQSFAAWYRWYINDASCGKNAFLPAQNQQSHSKQNSQTQTFYPPAFINQQQTPKKTNKINPMVQQVNGNKLSKSKDINSAIFKGRLCSSVRVDADNKTDLNSSTSSVHKFGKDSPQVLFKPSHLNKALRPKEPKETHSRTQKKPHTKYDQSVIAENVPQFPIHKIVDLSTSAYCRKQYCEGNPFRKEKKTDLSAGKSNHPRDSSSSKSQRANKMNSISKPKSTKQINNQSQLAAIINHNGSQQKKVTQERPHQYNYPAIRTQPLRLSQTLAPQRTPNKTAKKLNVSLTPSIVKSSQSGTKNPQPQTKTVQSSNTSFQNRQASQLEISGTFRAFVPSSTINNIFPNPNHEPALDAAFTASVQISPKKMEGNSSTKNPSSTKFHTPADSKQPQFKSQLDPFHNQQTPRLNSLHNQLNDHSGEDKFFTSPRLLAQCRSFLKDSQPPSKYQQHKQQNTSAIKSIDSTAPKLTEVQRQLEQSQILQASKTVSNNFNSVDLTFSSNSSQNAKLETEKKNQGSYYFPQRRNNQLAEQSTASKERNVMSKNLFEDTHTNLLTFSSTFGAGNGQSFGPNQSNVSQNSLISQASGYEVSTAMQQTLVFLFGKHPVCMPTERTVTEGRSSLGKLSGQMVAALIEHSISEELDFISACERLSLLFSSNSFSIMIGSNRESARLMAVLDIRRNGCLTWVQLSQFLEQLRANNTAKSKLIQLRSNLSQFFRAGAYIQGCHFGSIPGVVTFWSVFYMELSQNPYYIKLVNALEGYQFLFHD